MKVLFLDCISGISGDMMVGALCDLGVKPSALEWELSQLELGDFHMHFERQERQHISGIHFSIHEGSTHRHEQDAPCACPHPHDHQHSHGHEHAHAEEQRTYAQIRAMLEASDLSDFVKTHALSIFRRIAVAEAKIHGMPLEEVAFHEVGALDSIADIVCVCAGIAALGVEEVRCSPLADGRGWVETAHGTFPIPAPATLEILAGIPVGQIDEPSELITPTGAAIAAEFGRSFGLMPALRIEKIGYGLGSRSLPHRPNVLRAILGEANAEPAGPYLRDTVVRVETNLDDLSPEITGAVLNRLLEAGALDATLSPLQMKKNRPGVLLSVLCEEAALGKIAALLFAETTAFGIRMDRVERWKLDRRLEIVTTPYGEITVKRGMAGGKVVQTAPEFESCRAASERTGQPLRAVYEAALRAAR
ncbi:MAG: nickel pincer cofactor biosynthesis protein LarC [Verrucomicrobiota bacterium]